MGYLLLAYSYTSFSQPTWAYQIEIDPYSATGSTQTGTLATGTAKCSGSCTPSVP